MWQEDNDYYRATSIEAQNSHQFKMEYYDYGNESLHSREDLHTLLLSEGAPARCPASGSSPLGPPGLGDSCGTDGRGEIGQGRGGHHQTGLTLRSLLKPPNRSRTSGSDQPTLIRRKISCHINCQTIISARGGDGRCISRVYQDFFKRVYQDSYRKKQVSFNLNRDQIIARKLRDFHFAASL